MSFKRIIFITAIVFCSVSCSPRLYQQIGTIVSDSVYLQDDGNFVYDNSEINIAYDFWSEYGKFSFTITNKSDKDILLDMSQSYFINNGFASDYFENKSYYRTNNYARSVSSGGYDELNVFRQVSSSVNDKLTSAKTERQVICIPAHSYKVFSKFSVTSSAYRSCGFVRNPSLKEKALKTFDNYNSPIIFENRLVFYVENERVPIINQFYLASVQNMDSRKNVKEIQVENCNGTSYPATINVMASKNRYFIIYTESDVVEQYGVQNNDRVKPESNPQRKFIRK